MWLFLLLLQLYLQLLGGNSFFCLRDVKLVLEFYIGEPALQHLLHFKNDIDVFAPEKEGKTAYVEEKETQKEGEESLFEREGTKLAAILPEYLCVSCLRLIGEIKFKS